MVVIVRERPAGADDLAEHVAAVPLVDHHVHGAFRADIDRARFEDSINEASPDPIPAWMTQFDSQLGFAIRAHCAPLLDLEPHVSADDYWRRRAELGEAEVTRRFLRAAGVTDWLVDTGYQSGEILTPAELAVAAGGRAYEVVRVEAIAESLVESGISASDYPDAFRSRLAEATQAAVGLKSVCAYRCGFDVDWRRPGDYRVVAAARAWIDSGVVRLSDPTVIAFGVHTALDAGLPVQFHTGLGDRDLDLHRANPMLLLDLLRGAIELPTPPPIMLLHCYPYHREAGYLAQAFTNVYCDVGLALNYVGARARAVLAESLELAPFAKTLYSSDGWGPAELHYVGAALWRRAIGAVLGEWVAAGEWSAGDAVRVVDLLAFGNARRVYRLDQPSRRPRS
ncbi:MAG TPA: amidohydrolase family protein [Jatrophihabitans sp.]|nr:amidohydrolase family protein [Jatrophihabitans sp.]